MDLKSYRQAFPDQRHSIADAGSMHRQYIDDNRPVLDSCIGYIMLRDQQRTDISMTDTYLELYLGLFVTAAVWQCCAEDTVLDKALEFTVCSSKA